MKWTDEQIETLRKLCFEEKSNAEIAETLGCETKDIHSKRSQLGITIDKVKAAATQQKYIDNRPELMRRLREAYKLPKGDQVIEAMLEAIVSMVDQGYMEMVPVMEKYNDLVCRWCGRLHYRDVCQARMKE